MKHIELFESFYGKKNVQQVPILEVLSDIYDMGLTVLEDKNLDIVNKLDNVIIYTKSRKMSTNDPDVPVPGTEYIYKTEAFTKSTHPNFPPVQYNVYYAEKLNNDKLQLNFVHPEYIRRESMRMKYINPKTPRWAPNPFTKQQFYDLIKDLNRNAGKQGTLESDILTVKFTLVGPK